MNDNPMRDVIEQMKDAAQREGKQQTTLSTTTHEDRKPLDEQEQAQLIAIYQAFLQLPNAARLSLRFYADTSCTLHNDIDPKLGGIVDHWHDMEEAAEGIKAYAEYLASEQGK